ncbi:MAG TPA: hypothetical protein VFS35_02745 [Terrimicrobiaceae bacterium]|nr:hypothetical protein [Terrimicrobiaceae bacterium]
MSAKRALAKSGRKLLKDWLVYLPWRSHFLLSGWIAVFHGDRAFILVFVLD